MMKEFLHHHKKLHIWLGTAVAVVVLFHLVKGSRGLMNFVAEKITGPVKHVISLVSYALPFSAMELLIGCAVVFLLAYIIRFIVMVLRKRADGHRTYTFAVSLISLAVSIYAGFCVLWGVNYYTDSFQDKSGLNARMATAEELYEVTMIFVDGLNETADQVKRDENGLFAEDVKEIFAYSTSVYDNISGEFPCLAYEDRAPKKMVFGRVMSAMGFTGVYFPYVAESNLNVDAPLALLPATIAHELGHQRSIASEQECNFIGILASVTSDSIAYRYSGYLQGYIHLGNALYKADQALWEKAVSQLPAPAVADMRYNNAYWDQFEESVVDAAANEVYDKFLKSYGQTQGMKSYGTVVDLLVAYYIE